IDGGQPACAGAVTEEKTCTVGLICKPSALANYLLKHCRTFSNYSPCVGRTWRASAFLQSAYEACWPYESPVQFVRDNLQLSDDGLVALDWAVPSYQKRRRTSSHSTSPVLLIIPNSFGKITRNVLKVIRAVFILKHIRKYSFMNSFLFSILCLVFASVLISPIYRGESSFKFWPVLVTKPSYRTVLGETMQTDTLFSSCSLRGLEEALFCQTGHVGAWDAYWERNEPLRDVDEVAIPVLSVCARDDPVRGDTQSTIPLELFETNPHFFLLLTDRGGHCGFSTHHGANWSHRAVLEFFRATTDFFNAEERAKQLAARRRGLGGGAIGRVFRHRSVSTCKRVPACSHNIHAIYNWQRSYTR
uniref:Abhydrolase domain containing 15a n=1 Tax=Acanthochromis polyacanthus TaxID=80966 RepID=A0A3Q1F6C5_9TELE